MNFRFPPASKILAELARIALGMAIFWLFLWVGGKLKELLHLILPANVLGMLLLLLAISLKIVPVRHVELAGKWLLFFLPLLFVPIYAGAGAYKSIWAEWGWLLVPALVVSVIAMWIFVGHFSQAIARLQRKHSAP